MRRDTRRHFQNTFEEDGIEMITQRIMSIFGDSLSHAPKYTLERLIDAEIYWETLQKYPHMDALPVVLAYQKILDAWIEKSLIEGFRHISHGQYVATTQDAKLEKDIENIFMKNYTLSIGRLYQILDMSRKGQEQSLMISELIDYWRSHIPNYYKIVSSDSFFLPLSELMQDEIFSKKRHEKKVSFRDAQNTREILTGPT